MKRLFLIFAVMLALTAASAQNAIGTWQQYRAYGNATDAITADGMVFCVASGNLFSYDPETTEVHTFDIQDGMGGYGISIIEYDHTSHTLVVAYDNCAIDLIDCRTMQVVNLTSLKDASLQSKTINSIMTYNGKAWLCMGFGLIEIDLAERHFGETYDLGKNVLAAAAYGRDLYYSVAGDGLYMASFKDNLHDTAAHTRIRSMLFTKLMVLGDYMYGYSSPAIQKLDLNNSLEVQVMDNNRMANMKLSGSHIVASNTGKVIAIDEAGDMKGWDLANAFSNVAYDGKAVWSCGGLQGLQALKANESGVLEKSGSAIIPNSPRYDYFSRMQYAGNRLLVAGGVHEYTDPEPTYPGMAAYYEDGTWTNLDTVLIGQEAYVNITGITAHPDDPSLIYATSKGHGVYVYRDQHFKTRYSYDSSPLMMILPNSSHNYNYIRTNAPTFDADGNFWVLNCQVDTVLWRMSPNGKWKGFYFEELEGTTCPDGLYIDTQSRVWLLSRRMGGRGILCYDPNSKKHRLHGTITQQDGLTYAPDNFLCMAPDKNGYIWVGTEAGLFVIDRPDAFMDADYEWTQIKVNRDDGSGLADYLFSGATISAIAIDGANRKWIGTLGSGAYLISADGQETLHHFTSGNSPLPSDDIRSIAVNPVTGEVMIGTTKGLASYMSDATEPEDQLGKDNIDIYPNPVRPDYEGDVIIRGLAADCEVKIASVGGQMVWSGTSVGGTVTWNLQRKGGGRVASGIYNVIINTADASDVIVGRLAVIR